MCRCHIFRKTREPASANNARRGTERQNHINQGPFIIQRGAKSLAEPCAECNESDASVCPQLPVLSRVLFHEKASQMAPREQV